MRYKSVKVIALALAAPFLFSCQAHAQAPAEKAPYPAMAPHDQ